MQPELRTPARTRQAQSRAVSFRLMTPTRFLRALAPAAAILVARSPADAQHGLSLAPIPVVIHSTHWVVIPNIFAATPGTVTPNPLQTNRCNTGGCFDAPVTVQANTKWQLQVTLASASEFTVSWVDSRSPIVTHQLTPGVYQTVGTGTGPTLGQTVSLLFSASSTTGRGDVVPTPARLASMLSYRVIAAP